MFNSELSLKSFDTGPNPQIEKKNTFNAQYFHNFFMYERLSHVGKLKSRIKVLLPPEEW
jgi:hypothetical protein